jgi:uncharacterized membrane protein YbaN (DUF454 family)
MYIGSFLFPGSISFENWYESLMALIHSHYFTSNVIVAAGNFLYNVLNKGSRYIMYRKLPYLYYFLKDKIHSSRNKAFIKFIHRIFQSPVFKAAVPLLFTTGVSLEAKFIARPFFPVSITIFVYLVYIYFSKVSDTYQKRMMENAYCSKEVLSQISKINSYIASHKFDIVKKISSPMSYIPQSGDYRSISFQEIAFMICQAAFYALRQTLGKESFHVTLFARFRTKTKRVYIKMIAFANKNTITPAGFDNEYFLDEYPINKEDKKEKDFYHKEIFRKGENAIYALCGKNEIDGHFRVNSRNGSNVLKTKQYIGIPVISPEEGIVSLLQIETDEDGLLGKSKSEMLDLASYFLPLANFLVVNYHRDLLMQCLTKKINLIIKSRKKGGHGSK